MGDRMIYDIQTGRKVIVSDEYIYACYERNEETDRNILLALRNGRLMRVLLDLEYSLIFEEEVDSRETLFTNGRLFWSADLNYYNEKGVFVWPKDFREALLENIEYDILLVTKKYNEDMEKGPKHIERI